MFADASATPFTAPITRREIVGFMALCVFVTVAPGGTSVSQAWRQLSAHGFDLLAWAAVFLSLYLAPDRSLAKRLDVIVAACTMILCLAPSPLLYVAISVAGIYFAATGQDLRIRAAGTVLTALAAHKMWGPFLFWLFAPEVVRIDSVLAGLTFFGQGVQRTGDVFIASSGHGIELLAGCSSFQNVSLTVLCWVAVSKIENAKWRQIDFVVLLIALAVTVGANLARINQMALSDAGYAYWHDGDGAQIFQTVLSVSILMICYFGSRLGEARHA